jgi:hypothetical protein
MTGPKSLGRRSLALSGPSAAVGDFSSASGCMDPWQDGRRMSDVSFRMAEPGDADALADLWIEFGRYYAELDPLQ